MKKKAFTILELIVAMAIIAVLVALSFIAIQTVQRSQRNTERRAAANAIKNEIEAYYGDYGSYPSAITFANVAGTPRTTTVSIGASPNIRTLTLKSGAQIAMKSTGSLSSPIDAVSGAVYCYSVPTSGSYTFAVYLEGEIPTGTASAQYGNSSTTCPAASALRSTNAN